MPGDLRVSVTRDGAPLAGVAIVVTALPTPPTGVLWTSLGLTRTSDYTVPVGTTVTMDAPDGEVRNLTVLGTFRASRTQNTRLRMYGNLITNGNGRLDYGTPADPVTVNAEILWPAINESSFIGGGMDPVPNDHGLWVMGASRADIWGRRVTWFTRLFGSIPANARTFDVQDIPVGWQNGDEIVIAQTAQGVNSWQQFDRRRIESINGRTITLNLPTSYAHPSATIDGVVRTAHVWTLTRSVKIGGTNTGRTHIFCRSSVPQTRGYFELHHTGPRRPSGQDSIFVLGRYALHDHHCMDGSRGGLREGIAAHDNGSHVFVDHMSNGIHSLGLTSHDNLEETFWWDSREPTSDVDWDQCLASYFRPYERYAGDIRQTRCTGFVAGRVPNGRGTARGCVAVNGAYYGAHWLEGGADPNNRMGVWNWLDFEAYGNRRGGIHNWLNDFPQVHPVERFWLWHNGTEAIRHGAYVNLFRHVNFACVRPALITIHAIGPQVWGPGFMDGEGVDPWGIQNDVDQVFPAGAHVVEFPSLRFQGFATCCVRIRRPAGTTEYLRWRFTNTTWQPGIPEVLFSDDVLPGTTVILTPDPRTGTGSVTLRQRNQPGTYVARWNASVT